MSGSPRTALALIGAVLALLAVASAPAGSGRAVGTQALGLSKAASLAAGGAEVAVSGDGRVAIVGSTNTGGGTARIFLRRSSGWDEDVKLTMARDDVVSFGASVALSTNGRTALVGAPASARLAKPKRGSAWVFAGAGGGTWVGSKLPAGDVGEKTEFGLSVAISPDGKTAVVGGPGDKDGKGTVWVFARSGSGSKWKQTAKLTGKDAKGKARFGSSLALSADTLLVGGPADDAGSGAVWVFTRSGSGWKHQTKLVPRTSSFTQLKTGKQALGSTLALSDDGQTAFIGAPTVETATGMGIVFVARRSGSKWTGRTISRPSELLSQQERDFDRKLPFRFGASIALSGDGETALIGGTRRSQGAAWLFSRETFGSSGYTFRSPRLRSGTSAWSGSFGSGVALSDNGDVALVSRDAQNGKIAVAVYARIPVITGVEPGIGPTSGGTGVTITGAHFRSVRAVRFGSNPAASFAVDSETRIRAATPPGAVGIVVVSVTTDLGTSIAQVAGGFGLPPGVPKPPPVTDRFTYVGPPDVSAVTPASGPIEGGTEVRITGTGFRGASEVRFGGVRAASFSVDSDSQIRAVTPPREAGTVSVAVKTAFGTSVVSEGARFTYRAAETVVGFDDLVTGGPGQALVTVGSQYASQGVTFNSLSAVDYAKGTAALPGFARSGSVGLEPCIGVELCTIPVRAGFSAPKRLVRVWVGFSGAHAQPLLVRLTALSAAGAVIGTAAATLPASTAATPIRTPLEVSTGSPSISQLEVTIPGGTNNALAIDDVSFVE